MEYLVGLLWSRGQVKVSSGSKVPTSLIVNINVRANDLWKIDVLNILKNEKSVNSNNIIIDPILNTYVSSSTNPLSVKKLNTYLSGLSGNKDGGLSKDSSGQWVIKDETSFDNYCQNIQYDINNFNTCINQATNILETIIKKHFRTIKFSIEQPQSFNIRSIRQNIEIDPIVQEYLIKEYELPIGAGIGTIDVYEDWTTIPKKIVNGSYDEKINFIRGVADAIGTLEGETPRGIDCRIKFDIKQVANNLDKIKCTNLCHFIQDNLKIPIQTVYLRDPTDSRPHLVKIWAEDLRKINPFWLVKQHYQQRLDHVLGSKKSKPGIFCPEPNKDNIKKIPNFISSPGEYKTIPSPLRCYNYCKYIQKYCENNKIRKDEIVKAFAIHNMDPP